MQLAGLKKKDLKARARDAGVTQGEIDEADDEDDAKGALIMLILQREEAAAAAAEAQAAEDDEVAGLLAELQTMRSVRPPPPSHGFRRDGYVHACLSRSGVFSFGDLPCPRCRPVRLPVPCGRATDTRHCCPP